MSSSVYPSRLRSRAYANDDVVPRVSTGDGAFSPSAWTSATRAVRSSSYTSSTYHDGSRTSSAQRRSRGNEARNPASRSSSRRLEEQRQSLGRIAQLAVVRDLLRGLEREEKFGRGGVAPGGDVLGGRQVVERVVDLESVQARAVVAQEVARLHFRR